MSTAIKQQQKRQRVSLACDICRKKKIKCDGTKPTCKNCSDNDLCCTYTQPERKPKVKKERVNTLLQLDNRLGRIEQLLSRITPILETKAKKADSNLSNNRSNNVKNVNHKRAFPDFEDESSGQDSDEEEDENDDDEDDEDDEDDDDNFLGGESDDEDHFSTVNDQLHTPEEGSTTNFLRGEDEKPGLASEAVKGNPDTITNHSFNGNNAKRTKSAKMYSTSANDQANPDETLPSKNQRLSLDVPSLPTKVTLVGLANSLNEIKQTNPDIISATLLKSSENYCFTDTPFFFCSSTGLKWIADKTSDPTLASRFEKSFKNAHVSQFEQFRTSIEQCNNPNPISPDMLLTCAEVFKSEITYLGFMDVQEVDTLVKSELHPNPAEGRVNGFAEKIAIHCIVALGLIHINEQKHQDDKTIIYKTDLDMVRRQINSAYHYFFRFALIGNSIMGIKSLTLLSICMLFSVSHSPSLLVMAVAVRLAQEIGLHSKRYTENMPRIEAERNRRLWWALYCLEKNFNIMYSKPTTIIEETITTPLPQFTPEIDIFYDTESFCFMQKTTELYRLWSRVCTTLEKIETQRLKEKEKMQWLIEIDKDLLSWYNSIPLHSRPGYLNHFDSFYSNMPMDERLKFRFHHTLTHTVYYFIMNAIHRQVAYHPSWVYKVLRPTDLSGSSSDADATPKSRSVIDSIVASKTFNNTFNSAQATEKVHRSIVERHNNVKLVPKKIAADYPRFLRSFQLSVEYSRDTIDALCCDEGSAKHFSLSFFLLNAFITLLIKCLMQPKDIDTPNDLDKMQNVIWCFKRLSFFTSDIMPPDQENFLGVLKESVARYVERIRTEKVKPDNSGETSVPAKSFNSGNGSSSGNNNKNNNGNTLQVPPRETTTPVSVTSPSLYSILNSTNVDPVGSTSTLNNGKVSKQSNFDDQNNSFALNNSNRSEGLTDMFSEFENSPNNATTPGSSGPLDADVLFRMLNSNNYANSHASNTGAYPNNSFHDAGDNGDGAAPGSTGDRDANSTTGSGEVPPVPNGNSYDDYFRDLHTTMTDFNIFDSLYQLSSYWGIGDGLEQSWTN